MAISGYTGNARIVGLDERGRAPAGAGGVAVGPDVVARAVGLLPHRQRIAVGVDGDLRVYAEPALSVSMSAAVPQAFGVAPPPLHCRAAARRLNRSRPRLRHRRTRRAPQQQTVRKHLNSGDVDGIDGYLPKQTPKARSTIASPCSIADSLQLRDLGQKTSISSALSPFVIGRAGPAESMRLVLGTQRAQYRHRRIGAELCGKAEIAVPEHRGKMCGHEATRAVSGTPAPGLDVFGAEPFFCLPCRLRVFLVADEKFVLPALAKAGVEVNVNDPSGLSDQARERLAQVLSRALYLCTAKKKPIRVFVLPDRNGLAQLREPETEYCADSN